MTAWISQLRETQEHGKLIFKISAVDFFFFRLIGHQLNLSLKNQLFFRFSKLLIKFDRSGNDQKIDYFTQKFMGMKMK